ncbi:hypothetical protein C8R42DRAFT_708816 [Lentinula raphanica]|nr:hypothetical protein C8R42DRAFT_708816 [Lentinula raphanica]
MAWLGADFRMDFAAHCMTCERGALAGDEIVGVTLVDTRLSCQEVIRVPSFLLTRFIVSITIVASKTLKRLLKISHVLGEFSTTPQKEQSARRHFSKVKLEFSKREALILLVVCLIERDTLFQAIPRVWKICYSPQATHRPTSISSVMKNAAGVGPGKPSERSHETKPPRGFCDF